MNGYTESREWNGIQVKLIDDSFKLKTNKDKLVSFWPCSDGVTHLESEVGESSHVNEVVGVTHLESEVGESSHVDEVVGVAHLESEVLHFSLF